MPIDAPKRWTSLRACIILIHYIVIRKTAVLSLRHHAIARPLWAFALAILVSFAAILPTHAESGAADDGICADQLCSACANPVSDGVTPTFPHSHVSLRARVRPVGFALQTPGVVTPWAQRARGPPKH